MAEPNIRFDFDERKAADAAAYLLHLHGGEMKHMRLVKLLYAAERESLRRFNRPMLGDRYVSMDHGPVVSAVYNLIKEERSNPAWAVIIERSSPNDLRLSTDEPPTGSLSEAELAVLADVTERYRGLDQFEIRDRMHEEFAEWDAPPKGSARDIPVERLLDALGKSAADVERVRQINAETRYFRQIFGA